MSHARRRIWPPIVLMVAGAVLGILSIVLLVSGVVSSLMADSFTTPGSTTRSLDPGIYVVFERSRGDVTLDTTGAVVVQDTANRRLGITVTNSDGTPIAVTGLDRNESITRGSSTFSSLVEFEVVDPGEYVIEVSSTSAGEAIVARSLTDGIRHRVGWVFGILGGGAMFIAGLVWMIVALVSRSRQRSEMTVAYTGVPGSIGGQPGAYSSQPAAYAAPAGWYPEPGYPGSQRYWDGSAWTEHRHPPR